MADVRSLLRNERASRRITHPAASYSESGKLLCNICVVQIKTESLWDNHINSTQHNQRLQQARDNPSQGKKRKAGGEEDEGRKRVKGVPAGFFDQADVAANLDATVGVEDHAGPAVEAIVVDKISPAQEASLQPAVPAISAPNVDEDEWAAFERDIAAAEPPPVTISASAVISAAPMTAEEIAAQAREEQSTQRDRRQAEIEAENEDAEQAMLDEFDEMEELEVRVKRLREKREALRKARDGDDEVLPDVTDPIPGVSDGTLANTASKQDDVERREEEEDDEDDDEDDDFDDWNFGAN